MSGVLSNLSNSLAELVTAAGPSVARVEGRSRFPATGVVWSSEGVIVTSHHVLESDEGLQVGLGDGQSVPASLVGRDPSTDLAVLRTSARGLAAPAWANGDDLKVGHLVLALGRPGKSVRATLGIVSALGESWRTPVGGRIDRYLQTDVVMYPGFSGGPLVDAAGQVLGLNTSMLVRGVSMAVPGSTVKRVVEALLSYGKVKRGYLGVGAQPVRLPEALAQQVGQETGVLLGSVESGSPAERSGLTLGDVVVSLDNQPVRQMEDLLGFLSGERVGNRVTVRILRGGKVQELAVVIGERP